MKTEQKKHIREHEDFSDLEEREIPGQGFFGYNKLSLNSGKFNIELISPINSLDELQRMASFWYLLVENEDFKEQWMRLAKQDILESLNSRIKEKENKDKQEKKGDMII